MIIHKNVSLKKYNSFGIDHKAECIIHLKNEKEAVSLFKREIIWNSPLIIVGGGSNILFIDDFKGTILHTELKGIRVESLDKENILISAGAGVIWDDLVNWTVENGYYGLENLSLIPGTVGATPVQNIGAYGAEVKNTIEKVRTISLQDGTIHEFKKDDCKFDYRTSIFKNTEKGKYLITKVYFRLTIHPLLNLEYGNLKEEVAKSGNPTLRSVRQAVINIRKSKLPDPREYGNAGSFFKNPVVPKALAEDLRKEYTELPFFEDKPGKVKLAAGWLIDQCGWKGKRFGDAGVHERQALVIINYGNATGKDIFKLSEEIKKSVYTRFGIKLEREVEIVGTI